MNNLILRMSLAAQSMRASDEAQSITEYAMAFSLIALGTVAGMSAVAHSVNHTFITLATSITTGVTQQ